VQTVEEKIDGDTIADLLSDKNGAQKRLQGHDLLSDKNNPTR